MAGLAWDVPLPQVLSPPAGIPHSSGLQDKDCGQRPQSEILPVGMSHRSSRWGPGLQVARRSGGWCSERSDKCYWGKEAISFLLLSATVKIILLTSHKKEILQSLELDHKHIFPLKVIHFWVCCCLGPCFSILYDSPKPKSLPLDLFSPGSELLFFPIG